MEGLESVSDGPVESPSGAVLPPEAAQRESAPRDRQPASAPAAFWRRTLETQPDVAAGRNRLGWLAFAVLIAVAGGYGAWRDGPLVLRTLFGPPAAADSVEVSGNIEVHQSVLSFTQVAGPIDELPFDEGAAVSRGTVLARVDDRLYRQQVEIDRTNLAVASARIAASESTLAAVRHSVVSDRFDLAQKRLDYARAETLMKTRADTVQARDRAYTAAQQSAAALAHDQAMVEVAKNNVTLAQANKAAAEAKLKLDRITLSYTVLPAPFDGVISVRDTELGQLAGPGVAIFTLDDLDHPWLRAYVNEPDMGKIRLGEPVDVTTDTYPDKVYHGRISFISPQAEFTPKTVETHAQRVTLVYRVRIDINNQTHELLPGMPADARIRLLPAGK